jgi:FdhD protein
MSAATTRSTSSPAKTLSCASAPLMVAVSAPTALAVRMAEAAGITLAAIARSDGFEVFTHPERIAADVNAKEAADVA